MRIDTHQHFWRYRPADYPWIDGSRQAIARSFLPPDLEPLLRAAGFDVSIAVQARQTVQETEWLLELADTYPFIAGVIGWVDLSADGAATELDRLARSPRLLGIRHLVQDETDDRFMLRPEFVRGLALLAQRHLTYDLLIFPRHLAVACELVGRLPEQDFVLDHLAKPDIRGGNIDAWARALDRLARFPRVCAKISGLVTESDWQSWTADDIGRYIQVAYDCFGPDRLMMGSDWPVCTLAGDYGTTMSAAMRFVSRLPAAEQAAMLGGNAARLWKLDRRERSGP